MVSISNKKPMVTLDALYKHYLTKIHYNPEDYDEKRDKKVHRASMSGRCHKLQKYHMSDIQPKELDDDTKKVFRIGDLYHDDIQKAFKWLIEDKNKDKSYYELLMEQKITINLSGLEIDGHFDALLINHKDKKINLYDIKTMNPRAFSFFKSNPTEKSGYNKQLGVYVIWVKQKYANYDIAVILSAVSKDTGEFYEVVLDENDLEQDARDYYEKLAESMKLELDEIIPVRNIYAPIEKWECNYCNYNHVCNSPYITIK